MLGKVLSLERKLYYNLVISNRYWMTCKICYNDTMIGHLIYVRTCFLRIQQMLLEDIRNLALEGGSYLIITNDYFFN